MQVLVPAGPEPPLAVLSDPKWWTHCPRDTVLEDVDWECHTWVEEGGNAAEEHGPETHARRGQFWGLPSQRATLMQFPKSILSQLRGADV